MVSANGGEALLQVEESLIPTGKVLKSLPQSRRIDVRFDDLVYSVSINRSIIPRRAKECKTILKSVSGQFANGELVAILGPSGAGKSTLMNVLAGYKIRHLRSGSIKVNGELRNLKSFRKISSYIMENEELLPQLTVDEILDKLGLNECKPTRANKLSKGQRKRLSIAQELVNNPPVMFFDEPTSGLDSQSCYQCVRLLKSLAVEGRTIVCTIHQPSAKLFEMFDRLYVLADGMCIYQGSVPALLPYLKSQNLVCPSYHNPADFVIEAACGEYGIDVVNRLADCVRSGLCENLEQLCIVERLTDQPAHIVQERSGESIDQPDVRSDECRVEIAVETPLKYHPPSDDSDYSTFVARPLTQFYVLFQRTLKCILRENMLTQLRLTAHIVVGLLIGLLYFGIGNEASKAVNNTASLFFSMLFLVFTAMMPTIVTFPLEMSVFIREHLNCWYCSKAYYFAKSMADLPFQILFPVAYSTIVYWMTDQPHDGFRFMLFLLFSVLVTLTSQSFALMISAGVSIPVAVFLGPATAIPTILFCGFFVSFNTIPTYLRWLSYCSYIRYAFEGIMLTIYGFNRPELVCEKVDHTYCMMSDPKFILNVFEVKEENIWLDIIMLVVFFFVFRIGCYVVLKWRLGCQK